tara:strand:+ start:427 stop:663 length:237 start_codon:yes stop_codon:yes gene_type:complete
MNILKKVGSLAYHTQKLTVSIIKEPVDMASTIITGYKDAKQTDLEIEQENLEKKKEVEGILNKYRPSPEPVQQELDLS